MTTTTKADLSYRRLEWTHEGTTHWALVRAPTWAEEMRLVNDGAHFADYSAYWWDHLVKDASFPRDGVAREAWDADFGWAACSGSGLMRSYKRLGLVPRMAEEDRKNE